MKEFSLEGKRVTVLGWARSGRAAARLAARLGAEVFVSEGGKPPVDDELRGFAHETGGHTSRALEADIIVLSPGIPPEIPILRGYTGKIWSEVELAYRALSAKIVAITGTNGKTTTTTLIGKLLEAGYKRGSVFVTGNIGDPVSDVAFTATENDICVIELSSFQLETTEEFRPDVAVYLNLRSDHLDRYSSIDEYAAAKERIFMKMKAPDTAILNVDDARLKSLAEKLGYLRVITVSASDAAGFSEQALDAAKAPENLLASVAVAELFAVPKPTIEKVLSEFSGLPHRIEKVGVANGVTFYNDSKATNVASVEAALKRLPAPIVLILGGKDKGEDYRELIPQIQERCRKVIAYGEASKRISGMIDAEVIADFNSAVDRAFQLAKPDGIVLLSPACSSYDQFKDYKERGDRFRHLAQSYSASA